MALTELRCKGCIRGAEAGYEVCVPGVRCSVQGAAKVSEPIWDVYLSKCKLCDPP